MNNLALQYDENGRYKEAEKLYKRKLDSAWQLKDYVH